jgi:gamma-glutamyltranspeptidase/glutathione hydrolase
MPDSPAIRRIVVTIFALLAAPLGAQHTARLPVRDIAFARDGRLVASIEGDLWVQSSTGGRWIRLTHGPEWDRSPAWVPDASAIVYSSSRKGGEDLWRLAITADGRPGDAVRLTSDPAPDLEPTVAGDGTIIFVRGRLNASRLWQRSPTGEEKRFTTGNAIERAPAASPDGQRIAYIQQTDAGRRLRIRWIGTTTDSVVTSERPADDITWSPDGKQIALSAGGPRPGVYITSIAGTYVNYAGSRIGDVAWSPDGATILVAERSGSAPGYNGDPERIGDREASEVLWSSDRLIALRVPLPPDGDSAVVTVDASPERVGRNRDAFDRFVDRMADTYFSGAGGAARATTWRQLATTFRGRAERARDDAELDAVMHEMLRQRPLLRDEASGRAAVSSAHPVATAAGLEILRKGGNVVDAAVAVSFALGVVEPDASGIGGYGEMLVYTPRMRQPELIEFMARVPEEATLANAALMAGGRYPDDGPILAMVPGTVAAMHTAWKRHGSGKVPWAELLAPAIRAAKDGYIVSDGLATTLRREREGFAKYESSRALFFRDSQPRVAGDTIRNPDLAWTLEQIAKDGADGFYRGEVARRLVSDLRGKGNAIRLTDLSRYFAADREAVATTYRGHTIFSSAPPVSGGATLAAQLNNLEQVGGLKPYTEDAATLHAMIAAWQLVPSARNRIADPSMWRVDLSPFTSKDTALRRWKCFDPARALTPAMFRGDTLTCGADAPRHTGDTPGDARDESAQETAHLASEDMCTAQNHADAARCRAQGTTAFVVADAGGNVVAVTQTLGTWGGNFYVTPGLGFLYNDKLTSYGTDAGAYGARLPYARHGSTLAPTIVFRGEGANVQPVLAVGAAGNAWITSAVYQSLIGMLDFGLTPQRALELPRFLPSRGGFGPNIAQRPFEIDIEDGIAPDVMRRMREMGYRFNVISLKGELRMGYGAAVAIGDKRVTAGADPRRSGAAGAVER